jgi:hypothetical protein
VTQAILSPRDNAVAEDADAIPFSVLRDVSFVIVAELRQRTTAGTYTFAFLKSFGSS